MTYPTLPVPPERNGHSAHSYGLLVLKYLIEHECTALLSDDDLEMALHMSLYATQGIGGVRVDSLTVASINKIRHVVSLILKDRKGMALKPASPVPTVKPNHTGTSPVPLKPVPPTFPPSVERVKPVINF